MAAPPARHDWLARPWPLPRLRLAVVALLVVAIVAAAGGTHLLERVFNNYEGWERAWDRAERLGLSQTIDGMTVIVERAYMDANQILIGVTSPDAPQMLATLRVDGRRAEGLGMVAGGTRHDAAQVLSFMTPPGTGARARLELDARLEHRVTGLGAEKADGSVWQPIGPTWRFAFELPNGGGVRGHGPLTARASGVTMTLSDVVVSPISVSGELSFVGAGLDRTDDDWAPIGRVIRGEGQTPIQLLVTSRSGRAYTFYTENGFDAERGIVTVRIKHLIASANNGKQENLTIKGPWVFEIPIGD